MESHKSEGDQTSHKVIEKKRRDRINSCLSELSQTVPAAFSKQTSGKLEKAEILEMTVEYLRAIQATELGIRVENGDWYSSEIWTDFMQHYQTGYNDCIREIMRYMMDVEGLNVHDQRCARMMSYLQTRFKPDASVADGLAYRQSICRNNASIKSLSSYKGCTSHSSSPRFSPYAVNPRLSSYDFRLNGESRDSSLAKPTNISTPFHLMPSFTGLLCFADRNPSSKRD
ncbi:Hairy and enhancer of split-related protein helt,Hairy and enhancer of split-related protein HELT [Mytilus coruscus]|uniref:Hairy and enhancer of split-related protein HELT n=1 Tax=Mytilus coruscus TaxID=42192 RepID=A0A6J8B1F2_MYTCO|nr:Hairy and enhancer of split-related protein helt,Hairy and enhancer of split-related protein HELT [Mytilus coruscus]